MDSCLTTHTVSLYFEFLPSHRLSGLIVDIFGDIAVVASSAAWVEKYKPEIEACLRKIDRICHINWRPSVEILKEEGLEVSNFKETDAYVCPKRTKASNLTHAIFVFRSYFLVTLP